jgi:hypothetical protein
MFVREDVRLAVGFRDACNGLARLAQSGRLLEASQVAYDDGITGLTKVGPPGAWPDLSKLVMIHVGDVIVTPDSARLPLRWEATGAGSGLFPALDADITVTPDGDHAAALALTGVYRPPLGKLGALLDRAILSRVASATIRDFVGRLGVAIQSSSAAADHRPMDGVGS